jgi:hypothetical protein
LVLPMKRRNPWYRRVTPAWRPAPGTCVRIRKAPLHDRQAGMRRRLRAGHPIADFDQPLKLNLSLVERIWSRACAALLADRTAGWLLP